MNNWSLVPLTKIINAHSKPSRILWSIFSITMVGGLIISIILTVHKYFENATVFRMDYSTSNYFNDLPAVTICHNRHRINHEDSRTTVGAVNLTYELSPNNSINWSTKSARSHLYRNLTNYNVILTTDSSLLLRLTVVEQIPRPKDQICTLFELSFDRNESWTSMIITMNQENPSTDDYFDVVIHKKQSFPFNNYERYLYRRIDPGKGTFMFTAKSVANHLDTLRNPCSDSWVQLLNMNFSYDQTVCQWQHMCTNLKVYCHCSCELDVVGTMNHSCPSRCLNKYSRVLVNSSVCPQACHKTKYANLNVVIMDRPSKNISVLTIIMSNLVSVATEEPIYTLTKMFSEIGGLSSLLFGVSCILLFEVMEKLLRLLNILKTSPAHKRQSDNYNYNNEKSLLSTSSNVAWQDRSLYPLEVNVDDFLYSTFLSYDTGALFSSP